MSKPVWIVPEHDDALVDNLVREIGVTPTVARILANRGIIAVEEACAFLSPSLDQLHDPMLLPDMEAAVERTAHALDAGERILIHGDYDVDGVSSTALLMRTLSRLGANVVHRIPHRKRDGYDIKPYNADEAKAEGVSLIITADCGVLACETIERAQSLGIDMVITDHHEPGDELPKAIAVVNPMRHDSKYPFSSLAGVGVALKFAQALVRRLGYDDRKFIEKYLDLAALGTIADIMPLVGENRVIAKYGLEAMQKSKKVGIQALLGKTSLSDRKLTPYNVGYVLGPRINAVGRLDDATIALQLLLTADRAEADELVDVLEERNRERQAEQARVLEEAFRQIDDNEIDASSVLVLAGEGWNSGIVGIVASRVVEKYNRPAVLFSLDEKSGIATGSARSIAAFNMMQGLGLCSELLERVGGHALAAGLSLKLDNLPEFKEKLNQVASEMIRPEELVLRILVDGEIAPEDATWQLLDDIEKLEPFGHGNPEPLFISSQIELIEAHRVGADGSHLKMKVRGDTGSKMDCIAFRLGDMEPSLQTGSKIDLCYNVKANSYNGRDSVQLTVKDIRIECKVQS